LVLVWQLVAILQVWPRAFLPLPSQVAIAAADLTLTGSLPSQVAETTLRVVLGCAIGLALAVAIAVLLAMFPKLWEALKDIITYLQAVGEIGWLPLLILWSGFNDRTIVIVISYTVFFPVLYGTLSGLRTIPGQLSDSVRTLGGSRWHVLREVLLPGSLPMMITGLRAGMGFGWRTVIMAEMLVAQTGLGVILFEARSFFRVDIILVGMVVAGVLWLISDKLLLGPLERRTIQRWGIQSMAV
jgi:NitT/TauT family transport system permease protein/taurine transport system permease protein